MRCIVVRGATGVCVWALISTSQRTHSWQCTRDKFTLAAPVAAGELESFLTQLAQHSQGLVGAIAQVVELAL